MEESKFTLPFFQQIRLLLFIGGINSYDIFNARGKQWCQNLKRIYFVIVLMFYSVMMISFSIDIYIKATNSKDIMRTVAFFSVNSCSLFLIIIYAYAMPGQLKAVQNFFHHYERQYTVDKSVETFPRKMKITIVLLLAFCLAIYPLQILNMRKSTDIVCDALPYCFVPQPLEDVMFTAHVISQVLAYAHWLGFFTVCIFLSLFFVKEFDRISKLFQELSNLENRFEELVKQHDSLVDVLNATSDCFQHYSFTNLFLGTPINCSFLYAGLSKPLAALDVFYLCFGMSVALMMMLLRLFIEACVCSKAHRPTHFVWQLNKNSFSDRGLQKLSLFYSRLTGDTIGYSVYNILTINMSAFLGIVGTLATYFIIVIQFVPQNRSSQCDILMKNITYCIPTG